MGDDDSHDYDDAADDDDDPDHDACRQNDQLGPL